MRMKTKVWEGRAPMRGGLAEATRGDTWLSIPDAAQFFEVVPSRIYQLISRGQVRAQRIAGRLHVSQKDIARLQKARRLRAAATALAGLSGNGRAHRRRRG